MAPTYQKPYAKDRRSGKADRFKNASAGDKAVLLILLFLIVALPVGIVVGLNWTPRNENRNLKLSFDYGAYRSDYFAGSVVFKKDFEDVSLSMYYKPDAQYPGKVNGYFLSLTDRDGNEVSSVKAGVEYRFSAQVELDSYAKDYTVYAAGAKVSNDPHAELRFMSGGRTLYKVKY